MDHEFDRHTAVRPSDPGIFLADLDAGWTVGGGLNGGYLLGVVGSACREALPGKPHPVAVSAHYLGAATPGPAEIRTRVVRDGGSLGTVAAEVRQGEAVRLTALATVGDLAGLSEEVATTAEPPDLPPPERCFGREHAPPDYLEIAPMTARFDLRFDPDSVGWAVGRPSGRGALQAWFRLADGREPDPLSLLTVVDVLPPVTFDLGRPGWAPTLELTVHVRAVPAAGWLRVRHRTSNLAGGMFEEDCDVWDSAGRLVAQSRQLARVPR